MSDNNLPNEGMENEEVVDTSETITENDETTVEDDALSGEVVADGETNAFGVMGVSEASKVQASIKKFKTSAMIAWILVVVLVAGDAYYYMSNIYNKYNHMGYLDVNGYSIGEVVAGMGMEFDEFKEMYGLPKNLRKDTNMNAAQSLIPVSKMAELNGVDMATLKEKYKFGDNITETSKWGDAIDSMMLKDYVGEEQFDEFKTQYKLGDEITLDTKWGDIRKNVEKMQYDERVAAKKATPSPSATPSTDSTTGAADAGTPTDVAPTATATAEAK